MYQCQDTAQSVFAFVFDLQRLLHIFAFLFLLVYIKYDQLVDCYFYFCSNQHWECKNVKGNIMLTLILSNNRA